jgi:hypothetical protein
VTDRKIGLKPVGAGIAIATFGIAAAAVIGFSTTARSNADTNFKQDPVTVTATVTTPTTTLTPLTTLQSPNSAPSLPPAPPAP